MQIAHFKHSHKCLRPVLPWYGPCDDAKRDGKRAGHRRGGYDFDAVADAVAAAVRAEQGPNARVAVVCHDWGAVHGLVLQHRHPALVAHMVVLDIGPPAFLWRGPRWTARDIGAIAAQGALYQYQLVAAYLLSYYVRESWGDRLASSCARWAKQSMRVRGDKGRPVAGARGRVRGGGTNTAIAGLSGYPYYFYHANFVKGLLGLREPMCGPGGDHFAAPSCPCLFIYGAKKPFMFHTKGWARAVGARGDADGLSAVKGVPCGHWVQVERADEVNALASAWLARAAAAEATSSGTPSSRL